LLLLPTIGAAGLAAYLLVLHTLFQAAWADVILLVSRVLRRRRAKAGAVSNLADSAAGAG
jgi:hypothetical protein